MSTFSHWWTGTDTNNALPFPAGGQPQHFYIWRLGGELAADSYGLDIGAAKQATRSFPYLDLAGPDHPACPTDLEAATWGHAQAQAFIQAWRGQHLATGATLFLDTEPGNGGWGPDLAANRAVLAAALTALSAVAEPGVYISQDFWAQAFGAPWDPGIPFVLFLAGTPCPATVEEAIAAWETLPVVGGMRPMIWQWRVPGCAGQTQDWDLTPYGGWLEGRWQPTPTAPPTAPAASSSPAQDQTVVLLTMAQELITQVIRRLEEGQV